MHVTSNFTSLLCPEKLVLQSIRSFELEKGKVKVRGIAIIEILVKILVAKQLIPLDFLDLLEKWTNGMLDRNIVFNEFKPYYNCTL